MSDAANGANFMGLARAILARLERSTNPEWWQSLDALTFKLEDARRQMGVRPGISCDFEFCPAFLIASAGKNFRPPRWAQVYGIDQPVSDYDWCFEITTMVWCDPYEETWLHYQHLAAVIDENAYANACAARGQTSMSAATMPWILEPQTGGLACHRIAPHQYRVDDEARGVAIEAIRRWIEAVDASDIWKSLPSFRNISRELVDEWNKRMPNDIRRLEFNGSCTCND